MHMPIRVSVAQVGYACPACRHVPTRRRRRCRAGRRRPSNDGRTPRPGRGRRRRRSCRTALCGRSEVTPTRNSLGRGTACWPRRALTSRYTVMAYVQLWLYRYGLHSYGLCGYGPDQPASAEALGRAATVCRPAAVRIGGSAVCLQARDHMCLNMRLTHPRANRAHRWQLWLQVGVCRRRAAGSQIYRP